MFANIKKYTKKTLVGVLAAFMLSMAFIPPLRAQVGGLAEIYLSYIMQYTYGTLAAVNNLPNYLNPLLTLVANWQMPDTTNSTANLQAAFTSQASGNLQNTVQQFGLQKKLLSDFFGDITPDKVNYANDMSYGTLFGYPFYDTDPRQTSSNPVDSAYNYIKNAAGMNMSHPIPDPTWSGNKQNKDRYMKYYQTISAIQTFNAFALSDAYVQSKNAWQPFTSQYSLMSQASSPDWFKQISSESIGVVLRQILMFNSQVFVIMTQLLQTQKEMVTAQAMTNTLMIMGNQFTESQLLSKATGEAPGSR